MKRISFQGERGAYSEAASISFFGNEIESIPCSTFSDALKNTENDASDYSVLPVENSLAGSVGESNDLLLSTKLNAIGEIYHRIHHCLIGTSSIDDIDTVYSHPQALSQCREFIEENSLKTIPSYDTAGSVKIIKDLNKNNIACIASKNAAEIFDVPVIKEGVEDNTNNYTRFLVFSKESNDKTENNKTSIIFSVKHEAGALYQIINEFYQHKINLTKIESRPNRNTVWEYNFYVDFEGNQDDSSIKNVLQKLRDNTTFLKILGSYPIAKLN
uniref:prephenate dehydratase n=1 Tax=uncultured marine thaumarchaeote KM3_78_E10 TaxID=1456292 RepID=A0A075HP90_9ARCH|nr:prephenate dehydratase (pheA2) [uncultured marine thaumarchaeote KM3_78_E10]